MNIYKLINWQKEHSVSVPKEPDIQVEPADPGPWDPVYVQDITLRKLLHVTGRSKKDMPGEGHSNCGFNSILEQIGDRTRNPEMVNLLRNKLRYGDENSNQMFDTNSSPLVAKTFDCPVAEICQDSGKVVHLSFSVPNIDLVISFANNELLSQNLAAWCTSRNWGQDRLDTLSRWLAINIPALDFGEAELNDVLLQLLQNPTTIVLVSVVGVEHFDAAPHKDLQRKDSVLEFLRRAES
ncbi:MAG: hypothetical protein LBF49_01535 [Puniceicoccales bacterium]|jgi:hypothetical protein|nr:hypothetical protein [Puniceicoccales bacterium]